MSAGSSQRADEAARIGRRLAALRRQRGLQVSELARRAGVSASLVSQLERGRSRPSVSTLLALADAVGARVDALFRADEAPPATAATGSPSPPQRAPRGARYVVRRAERAAIEIEGGVRWERLTPAKLDGADVVELVYGPHAESHPRAYRHPGSESVLLLSGRLIVHVDGEPHNLRPGDSISFPSSCEHRYVNPTDQEARAVSARVDER